MNPPAARASHIFLRHAPGSAGRPILRTRPAAILWFSALALTLSTALPGNCAEPDAPGSRADNAPQAANQEPAFVLPLPPRPSGAPGGLEIARRVAAMSPEDREEVFVREILSGNVPDSWRKFVRITPPVPADNGLSGGGSGDVLREGGTLSYWAAPDYLAVGSDADSFRTPLSPGTAQSLADRLDCVLPTRRMVDQIHTAAPLKLEPLPQTPGPEMTSVPFFLSYQEKTRTQRLESLTAFPPGTLTAGHQKDVVVSALPGTQSGKVAIYGWHRPDGRVIQPLYAGHTAAWVDYSHGIRLIRRALVWNGGPSTVGKILSDPATASLLSDEGPVKEARYPASDDALFAERTKVLKFEPEVRALINRPAHPDPAKPLALVIYATPNGSSIEQTMGRHFPDGGGDWRFEIQHIAAQIRWLRQSRPASTWILACVECGGKAWPAWRRRHPDSPALVAGIVDALARECRGEATTAVSGKNASDLEITLTGHSGGGAFTFALLDHGAALPGKLRHIAFLDSNYGYDSEKSHDRKLISWLKTGTDHRLTVIAYQDSAALLNGKPFVSEQGGTWGRSQAMLADFGSGVSVQESREGPLRRVSALDSRLRFLLMENPERAILHTLLVEKNGLLEAILGGGAADTQNYRFFGEPVYREFISGGGKSQAARP